MNRKGLGGKALCMSLYAGVLGGLISVFILVFTVIPLSQFALKFGPTEYFWMAIMGLSVVGAVSGNSPMKGFISAVFGLFLAVIGMDSFTAVKRFTFGINRLSEGLEMIPVLVGMFAVSEVLRQIFGGEVFESVKNKFKMTYPTRKEFMQCTPIVIGLRRDGLHCRRAARRGRHHRFLDWIFRDQNDLQKYRNLRNR